MLLPNPVPNPQQNRPMKFEQERRCWKRAKTIGGALIALTLIAGCGTKTEDNGTGDESGPTPQGESCSPVTVGSPWDQWVSACMTNTGYKVENIHPVQVLVIEAAEVDFTSYATSMEAAEVDVKDYAWSLINNKFRSPNPVYQGTNAEYLPPGSSTHAISTERMPNVYLQTVPDMTTEFITALAVARFVDEGANIAVRGRQLRTAAAACTESAGEFVRSEPVQNQSPSSLESRIAQGMKLSPCLQMATAVKKEIQYSRSLPSLEDAAKSATKSVTAEFLKDMWHYTKPAIMAALR